MEKLKNVIAMFGRAINDIEILNKGAKSIGINSITKFPIFGGINILLKVSIGFVTMFINISEYESPQSLYHTAAICALLKSSALNDGITIKIQT